MLVNLDTGDSVFSMSESPHQLAAIVFIDIVGYSALMGNDEEEAFELLEKNRALQKPIIEGFGGQYLKEIGDGILASFPSASDAVYCAGAIHKAALSMEDLSLRIGIHVGDVVFKEKDVFGDGVNIASRIQELAKPGQTLISESVYRNVVNKKGIDAQFIKEEHLKNISVPLKIYKARVDTGTAPKSRPPIEDLHPTSTRLNLRRLILILITASFMIIALGYLFLQHGSKIHSPAPQGAIVGKSLVVLPFVNISNDPSQEYFSDGITEEIINAVVQFQDLKVIGRTSAFAYKNQNIDLKVIGQQLNVQNILEGSIRKDGNRIRVTAQLINADNGYHLWSEQYDREFEDIFEIYDDVSGRIAEKLQATLLRGLNNSSLVNNLEAYDAVLQGNYHLAKHVPESAKAIEFYKHAVELDPNYPFAYTQLGWGHLHQAWGNYNRPESLRKAQKAFQSALYLDPKEPRAQLGLAWVDLGQWQWDSANKHYQAARALNASGAGIFEAWYRTLIEADFDRSIRIIDEMIETDPLALEYLENLGQINLIAGRYDQAGVAFSRILKIDPESEKGYSGLGWSYLHAGNLQEATINFTKSKDLSSNNNLPEIELALDLVGSSSGSGVILERLQDQQSPYPVDPLIVAKLLVLRGEDDLSLSWLEKAFEQNSMRMLSLRAAKIWDPLRLDTRFQTLLSRIKFPEESMLQPN